MENIQDQVVTNVFSTTDYAKFTQINGNRGLNPVNLEVIKASFAHERGISPIVVNERFEVIDGQHRLEACKQLGIPVYYIIEEGSGSDEIIRYNVSSRSWNLYDYIEFYKDNGSKPAERVLNLCAKYNVAPSILAVAAGVNQRIWSFRPSAQCEKANWMDDNTFTEEQVRLADSRLARAMEALNIIKANKNKKVTQRSVLTAALQALKEDGFDYDRLLQGLREASTQYVWNSSALTSAQNFCQIMNMNKRSNFVDVEKRAAIKFYTHQDRNRWRV